MNDDVRKYIYTPIVLLAVGLVVWIGFLFVNACGFSLACNKGIAAVERTPVPTLIPATMPAPPRLISAPAIAPTPAAPQTAGGSSGVPQPSNPGGAGEAVNLTGDAAAGEQIFAANCVACHGAKGAGSVSNPGSADGTVPALNPVDPLLKDANAKTFAANIDLFIQHGSTPAGPGPTFQMPAWGDLGALTQQQIADVIAYIISLNQ